MEYAQQIGALVERCNHNAVKFLNELVADGHVDEPEFSEVVRSVFNNAVFDKFAAALSQLPPGMVPQNVIDVKLREALLTLPVNSKVLVPQVFKMIDRNNDGVLDAEEISLSAWFFLNDHLAHMYGALDVDGDGEFTKNDLMSFVGDMCAFGSEYLHLLIDRVSNILLRESPLVERLVRLVFVFTDLDGDDCITAHDVLTSVPREVLTEVNDALESLINRVPAPDLLRSVYVAVINALCRSCDHDGMFTLEGAISVADDAAVAALGALDAEFLRAHDAPPHVSDENAAALRAKLVAVSRRCIPAIVQAAFRLADYEDVGMAHVDRLVSALSVLELLSAGFAAPVDGPAGLGLEHVQDVLRWLFEQGPIREDDPKHLTRTEAVGVVKNSMVLLRTVMHLFIDVMQHVFEFSWRLKNADELWSYLDGDHDGVVRVSDFGMKRSVLLCKLDEYLRSCAPSMKLDYPLVPDMPVSRVLFDLANKYKMPLSDTSHRVQRLSALGVHTVQAMVDNWPSTRMVFAEPLRTSMWHVLSAHNMVPPQL